MNLNILEEMDSTGGGGDNPGTLVTSTLFSDTRGATGRRRDLIEDPKKRRNYFELYFRKLTCQLHRVESRTGCEGSLTGTFEGKKYSNKSSNDISSPLSASFSDSMGQETDDHRYAATMLTQNVSSTAVRDHQYDEKTLAHVPDTDTSDYDEDTTKTTGTLNKSSHKKRRLYKYDYMKNRCVRDQNFGRLAKTLFGSTFLLQQRTGASFKLVLDYEGCKIDETNFDNTSNAIAAHRTRLRNTKFNLAPKQVMLQLQPQVSSSSSSTPLTFIIPNFSPVQMTVPCILPSSSPRTAIVPLGNISMSAAMSNASLQFNEFPCPNPATICKVNAKDSSEIVPKVRDLGDPRSNVPSCVNALRIVDEESTEDNNQIISGTPSPTFVSAAEEVEDIEKLLTFTNNSPQNSFEMSVPIEMKDSCTNTEHICSICWNRSENSTSRTRDHSSSHTFWIRCNDPFCYDVVHASCVGFVVTHSTHLKQLPAFYCKSHR